MMMMMMMAVRGRHAIMADITSLSFSLFLLSFTSKEEDRFHRRQQCKSTVQRVFFFGVLPSLVVCCKCQRQKVAQK